MLSALAYIYEKLVNVRNALYDRDILDVLDLGAHTISVGNITAGGTGKTPLVGYIARLLSDRGETVCILTRGYGRNKPKERVLVSNGKQIITDAMSAGDEPVELAHSLGAKAIIIADADRVAAAEWALRKFDVSVLVLDDGFQHRRAKRDVDIVCIDATDPFGGGSMLPKGRLREPVGGLCRAGIVVITRANLSDDLQELTETVSEIAPDAKVFTAANKTSAITPLVSFFGNAGHDTVADARPAFAFCGLGNPSNFFDQLKIDGIDVAGSRAFRDHHRYSQADVCAIETDALASGAKQLLTTAKDAVKLGGLVFSLPCNVVEISVEIDDAETLNQLL